MAPNRGYYDFDRGKTRKARTDDSQPMVGFELLSRFLFHFRGAVLLHRRTDSKKNSCFFRKKNTLTMNQPGHENKVTMISPSPYSI